MEETNAFAIIGQLTKQHNYHEDIGQLSKSTLVLLLIRPWLRAACASCFAVMASEVLCRTCMPCLFVRAQLHHYLGPLNKTLDSVAPDDSS